MDDWVLGFCTRVAHWFQILTGRTNFFLAKIGIRLATLEMVVSLMGYFYPVLEIKITGIKVVFCIIMIPQLMFNAHSLDKAEKLKLSSEKAKVWGLVSLPWMRLLWLFFAVVDTLILVEVLEADSMYKPIKVMYTVCFSYGLMVFCYFIAVEPLSPRKSLIRKLLESVSSNSNGVVPAGTR